MKKPSGNSGLFTIKSSYSEQRNLCILIRASRWTFFWSFLGISWYTAMSWSSGTTNALIARSRRSENVTEYCFPSTEIWKECAIFAVDGTFSSTRSEIWQFGINLVLRFDVTLTITHIIYKTWIFSI